MCYHHCTVHRKYRVKILVINFTYFLPNTVLSSLHKLFSVSYLFVLNFSVNVFVEELRSVHYYVALKLYLCVSYVCVFIQCSLVNLSYAWVLSHSMCFLCVPAFLVKPLLILPWNLIIYFVVPFLYMLQNVTCCTLFTSVSFLASSVV